MAFVFVLDEPQTKNFMVKKTVHVPVITIVKKKVKRTKEVLRSEGTKLPIVGEPKLLETANPYKVIEVEEEIDVPERTMVDQVIEDLVQDKANAVLMTDAHNDMGGHRLFTHFYVGRLDDKGVFWAPGDRELTRRTDGLVFGGDEYVKRGYHDMLELDEKRILVDVVTYFQWKGKLNEVSIPDDFHDTAPRST